MKRNSDPHYKRWRKPYTKGKCIFGDLQTTFTIYGDFQLKVYPDKFNGKSILIILYANIAMCNNKASNFIYF